MAINLSQKIYVAKYIGIFGLAVDESYFISKSCHIRQARFHKPVVDTLVVPCDLKGIEGIKRVWTDLIT
tara:strand:+ start:66 stop:272 length:207 start_codon:yes stop_codon:yes gene_type:complete